ncbi:aspartate aminotransferase family protein [Serratia oryzae]|uniref:Aspartate aminotransferase family protein n=1 Tax=Serratia oryzae TaxID=2034155 RepID=A0A1S8CND9_9GAMM|nr:aspartate aminotransferase family protein [Serratia oryzae]OMQ26769.1 aspartate aminotransferase family protein [Serratia oryzae]VXC75458.1 Aspartate aminotransferase family protein [Enterobacterales bacterium 8AC]
MRQHTALPGGGLADTEGDINRSVTREHWWAEQSEAIREDLAEDSRYFLHQALSTPCLDVLARAEGTYLTSQSGKQYLDFHGNSVHQLGHGHPKVVARVQQQLTSLPFAPRRYTHSVAIKCARTLANLAPGDLNRVLFAPGGSEVVGIALKLARFITGNSKVVSLWDSFHGASLDAISVGGEACFRAGMGPLLAGVERIPPPTRYRGVWYRGEGEDLHYADYLEYVIEKEGGIGAFIAEPIRNTDVQVPSKAYWQRIREICDRHGVLLIADEIPNALGRTGHWFSFEQFGIEPDIICLGKGLGGGIVPFAALITRDRFNQAAAISLGHYTHEKSPIGCAAALATIEVIRDERLLAKVQHDGRFMADELAKLARRYPLIGQVRGTGLLWALDLVRDHLSRERATGEAEQLLYRCLTLGLSFKVSQGNVIQLSPPLTISRADLARAISILDLALSQIEPTV